MVIATQNPIEQAGTYRLPEAQLDRFLMKTSVGYPDAESTEELLLNSGVRDRAALVEPIMKIDLVSEMSRIADEVHVDRAVVTYVRQLAEASRDMEHVRLGLSPRGCLALIRVMKTWAVADGREYVVPEDVAQLAHPVLGHRLILDGEAQFRGVAVDQVIDELLDRVRVPSCGPDPQSDDEATPARSLRAGHPGRPVAGPARARLLPARHRWRLAGFQLLWLVCVLLMVVAVAFALLPRRGRATLQLSPPRTMAGDDAQVHVSARSAGFVPVPSPLISVPAGRAHHLVRLRTLRRGTAVEERIDLTTLRRGVVQVGPVTARRTDPLSLLRWDERWSPTAELLVLPRMVDVESLGLGYIRDQEGTPSDEISMSDLAFHALREYVPGDDLRHVHWRSSAKADTLQIRQYQDTRRSHLTVVIDDDSGSYADPEDFETAVSAAASIAARAHRDGVDLSMLCGEHAVTGRGLDGVLDACCRIEPGTSDPVQAAREAMRLAPQTSWLVMVTGAAASGNLAGVAAFRAGARRDLAADPGRRRGSTTVARTAGARLVTLRVLDELPRALSVAVQGVPA